MELRVYLLLLFPWLAGKSPLSLFPGGQPLAQGALVGQGSCGSSVAGGAGTQGGHGGRKQPCEIRGLETLDAGGAGAELRSTAH